MMKRLATIFAVLLLVIVGPALAQAPSGFTYFIPLTLSGGRPDLGGTGSSALTINGPASLATGQTFTVNGTFGGPNAPITAAATGLTFTGSNTYTGTNTFPGTTLPASPGSVNLYVATSGSDTGNSCLVSSSPCLTINHAIQESYVVAATASITINLAAGTYAQSADASGQPYTGASGYAPVQLILDGAGSASTTVSGSATECDTVSASFFAVVAVENMTLTGTAQACTNTLYAQEGGFIQIYPGVVFGAASHALLHTESLGQIQVVNSFTTTGSSAAFAESTQGGVIGFGAGSTITIQNGPSFSEAFLDATDTGFIGIASTTVFSGPINGTSIGWIAANGGVIDYNGATLPNFSNGYTVNHGAISPAIAAMVAMGSKTGTSYTTTSTTLTPIDATNLVFTLPTIPSGQTYLITATANGGTNTGSATIDLAIVDTTSSVTLNQSTTSIASAGNSAALVVTASVGSAQSGHTVTLEYDTNNASNAAFIFNATTQFPIMIRATP